MKPQEPIICVQARFNQLVHVSNDILHLTALLKRKKTKYTATIWTDAWSDLSIAAVESKIFKKRFEGKRFQDYVVRELQFALDEAKARRGNILHEFPSHKRRLARTRAIEVAKQEGRWL